jgi:hypothetical protein
MRRRFPWLCHRSFESVEFLVFAALLCGNQTGAERHERTAAERDAAERNLCGDRGPDWSRLQPFGGNDASAADDGAGEPRPIGFEASSRDGHVAVERFTHRADFRGQITVRLHLRRRTARGLSQQTIEDRADDHAPQRLLVDELPGVDLDGDTGTLGGKSSDFVVTCDQTPHEIHQAGLA